LGAGRRGELARGVDAYALIENLVAAPYTRALVTGGDLDDPFVAQQVANTIAAFARNVDPDDPIYPSSEE
jgi:hypothetical protein